MDFNNIQESLRSALTSSSRRSTSPQDALSEYLGKNLTLLVSRPAFLSLIQDLAGRLVSGEALDIEGLADVLTLKDNLDERGRGDPCMALQKLRSDKVSFWYSLCDKRTFELIKYRHYRMVGNKLQCYLSGEEFISGMSEFWHLYDGGVQ